MQHTNRVDPAYQTLVEAFPVIALTNENLSKFRSRTVALPKIEDCEIQLDCVVVPGAPGDPKVPLRIFRPRGINGILPCIYYIHGGGYISGSASQFEFLHRPLAAALACALVAVDYRLAPETVFPGAIEDCYAGLRWLVQHASKLKLNSARLGVMGDSAGGGLAASLALLVRDRGKFSLAFQHLIYPMLDDRTGSVVEPAPGTGEFVWTGDNNRFAWSAFLGNAAGADHVSPYAAAARAYDLSGLPPAFISCGALDLFAVESIDYARRLVYAGVPTELHIYPHAIHGFDLLAGNPLADAAIRDSRTALARFLA